MKPNKHLGQHWLEDKRFLEAVAEAAEIQANDTVLEIGPGLGTLTKVLLGRGAEVIAIEKDPELARKLFKDPKLEVFEADILSFDRSHLTPGYKVAANIPYYLTSQLIRQLLYQSTTPSCISLLIQKEVAERIAANPGNMSVLSCSVQFKADVKLHEIVEARYFYPPPNVDSQIISIKPRNNYFEADEKKIFRLWKAAFGEKRKKMSNSISGGLKIEKDIAEEILASCGLSTNARAQELSMEKWGELYNKMKPYL